jgi:hypothetical protein
MTAATISPIEYHLGALDRDACGAFVADLWSRRGYDTAREGEVVVATGGGETIVIYPAIDSRFGRTSMPDRTVGVAVAPTHSRSARALRERDGCRVLDAADLRELLWYAVDREARRQLCVSHFGAPPDELSMPAWRYLHGRTRRTRILAAIVTVALVALVGITAVTLVAGLGASDLPVIGDGGDDSLQAERSTEDPQSAAVGGENETTEGTGPTGTPVPSQLSSRMPSGVSSAGIANRTALAAAHERAVTNRSYTLVASVSRQPETQNENEVRRIVEFAVEGNRYVSTTTIEQGDSRFTARERFYDGETVYIADFHGLNTTYRRDEDRDGGGPSPFELRREVVGQYLAVDGTNMTGQVSREGRTHYRLVGNGRQGNVDVAQNYTVVALVDSRGFVRRVASEYTLAVDTRRYAVDAQLRYRDLGEVTVGPPDWYEQRFASADTDGYNFVSIFDPAGGRNRSRAYSR